MANKNSLSQNTRTHSKLDDIAVDPKLENVGFEVEFEDAVIPTEEADAKRWKMDKGMHMLRAISYDVIDHVTHWTDEYGVVHDKTPYYSIGMEDIKTGDIDYIEVPMTEKGERSFKNAINTRSKRDLGRKIAPRKVTELSMKSVANYLAKFPAEFLYDKSTWVDENGEYQTSKNPKIHIWMQEDFTNRYRSSNWVSLR